MVMKYKSGYALNVTLVSRWNRGCNCSGDGSILIFTQPFVDEVETRLVK